MTTIHGFSPSTYTQTALLVAAEAGVDVELAPLELGQASHYAMHPFGKMPVLRDGELTLFETLAIATYLDAERALQPSDPVEHARMHQWISAAIDYGYAALVSPLHGDTPSSDAIAEAGKQLELLDGALAGREHFASSLSLADLFLFPMVRFAVAAIGDGALERLPNLRGWVGRMSERESARGLSQ